CTFCNIWQEENKTRQEHSLEDVKNNLIALKKLGVKAIDFTGGEPLLYPHIIEVLSLAKEYGFRTILVTNGILYPKYAHKLKGLVDALQFSFDDVDEDIHNKSRGVNCYNKVMRSIEIAKKIKQKICLIHVVTKDNITQVPKAIKFAQNHKCIIALSPCFNYFGSEGLSKNYVSEIKQYFKEKFTILDLANLKLIANRGNDINNPVCKAVSSTVVISPDNYLLLPCYHHHVKKIKIENNLVEIYSSAIVNEIKKKVGKYDFCKNCTINCYMRTPLLRTFKNNYFFLSLLTVYNYIRERFRKQY
ncbi:MAG: radical SAM protein, partial [Lentisphaerae bacterium]|nr:radical SAM protein [Lentisphaerota bacterium]MCP4102651.1 radical SAM protein [Lentisphaerota bacterium]